MKKLAVNHFHGEISWENFIIRTELNDRSVYYFDISIYQTKSLMASTDEYGQCSDSSIVSFDV